MIKPVIIFIFSVIVSCKSVQDNSEPPQTKMIVDHYKNGQIKSVGEEDVRFKDFQFRIGHWKEFYENGQLRESGNYELGTYKQCCTLGICDAFYSYKIGEWTYYHPNGQLKAKGTYEIGTKHKKTSCQGGDEINFGYVTDSWVFYDEDGMEIIPKENEIAEIEGSSVLDEWDMNMDTLVNYFDEKVKSIFGFAIVDSLLGSISEFT